MVKKLSYEYQQLVELIVALKRQKYHNERMPCWLMDETIRQLERLRDLELEDVLREIGKRDKAMTVPVVSRPNEDLKLVAQEIANHGRYLAMHYPESFQVRVANGEAKAALARVQARIEEAEKALMDIAHLPDMSEDWHDGDVAVQIARAALAVSGGRESETG